MCLQQPPQPPWVCFCFVGWGAGAGGGRRAGFRSLFAEPLVGVEKTSPKSVWAFLFPDLHDKAKKGNRRRTNPSAQEREGEDWEGARGGALCHISSIYDAGPWRGGPAPGEVDAGRLPALRSLPASPPPPPSLPGESRISVVIRGLSRGRPTAGEKGPCVQEAKQVDQ